MPWTGSRETFAVRGTDRCTVRVVTRRGIVLLLGLAVAAGGGCGGGDEAGTTTSPVSGEPRSASEDVSLSALIGSPGGAAVPFQASSGKVLVSYELRLVNATPFTLTAGRVSISTPDGAVVRKLDRRQVRSALALPSARSGVRALEEGQQATLYLTVDFEDRARSRTGSCTGSSCMRRSCPAGGP